jgi:integrase
MPKITKRVVDALKPEDKDVFIWDSELRGFGVRVKPSGAAAFIIQYRNKHGRTRRMVVGKVGTLSPKEARDDARDYLALAAKGEDPSGERHASRKAITVNEVCDWYLEQAGKGELLGRRRLPIKSSTLALDRSRIERHVRPLIGNEPVDGLTVAKLEKMQSDILNGVTKTERPSGRGGRTTGGAAVAGRTLGMLSAIFEHAARKGLISTNPAKGTKKIAAEKRRERLSLEQLADLGASMNAEWENPTGVAAIRLIALTGFRREEALGLRKSWIIDTGGIAFPDTKSGPQVRPIGKSTLDLLKSLCRDGDSDWIFPSDYGDGHFVGIRKVLDRIANRAGLRCTPHVLRHTFSSVAADLGYSELVIAGLLGHSSRGVTQDYVHLDRSLVAAADRISAVIASALDGHAGADLINLYEAKGVSKFAKPDIQSGNER